MPIVINPAPVGVLIQKADILAWAEGLTEEQWKKIRPHLTPVKVLGCKRHYYAKREVKTKLIDTLSNHS